MSIGSYERPPVAWFGAALAVVGLVAVLIKGFLPISDTDALYQFLNTIGLPFIGVGAALFLFMSRYTIKLQTTSGTVQVLSARNRAYVQKVSDALVAALKSRTAPAPNPRQAAPARKSKR